MTKAPKHSQHMRMISKRGRLLSSVNGIASQPKCGESLSKENKAQRIDVTLSRVTKVYSLSVPFLKGPEVGFLMMLTTFTAWWSFIFQVLYLMMVGGFGAGCLEAFRWSSKGMLETFSNWMDRVAATQKGAW